MVRGCSSGCSCLVDVRVHVTDPRGIQFALGSCYAVHITHKSIVNYNESVHCKEEHAS